MNESLNQLKNITSDCCVSILLTTHRTPPGNEKDDIVLKNLVREAETRLKTECERENAKIITEKINQLVAEIDYRYNLEGLAIFVSAETAQYIRLPVNINNQVIIAKNFATRDLVRALNEDPNYFILVLSQEKARLIQAWADREVREVKDGFPKENSYTVPDEGDLMNNETSLVLDFFTHVDEELNQLQKDEDLPVFICTDEPNYAEYMKVARRKETVAGFIPGNKDSENARDIIDDVWPTVEKWNEEKNKQKLTELSTAVGAQLFLTDFTQIWKAIGEGRGRILFVKKGYFQPANLNNNVVQLVSKENADEANVQDIIGLMIEKNREFDGETVFISGDELDEYSGLVLVTRY
ncbi:MAG TPA: hypothetical protein VN722_03640 [Hanamia sp.]|nr:hypothetical protein [Hanamia sp.]